jgi:hypothetical protein
MAVGACCGAALKRAVAVARLGAAVCKVKLLLLSILGSEYAREFPRRPLVGYSVNRGRGGNPPASRVL